MSQIWYDHLILLDDIDVELAKLKLEPVELEELHQLIDETIHLRIMDKVLQVLPSEHHSAFLIEFKKRPHDDTLIDYINAKIESSVEEHIAKEIENLKTEILEDLKIK